MGNTIDWKYSARKDFEDGIYSVQVEYRNKKPIQKGWQNLRITECDLDTSIGELNRGRLLGIPPPAGIAGGWLVCVDLDATVSRLLAPFILPTTAEIGGRGSAPHSHYFFESNPPPGTRRYKIPKGIMLVEILSTGTQVIVEPSVHPSGEFYRWDKKGTRGKVSSGHLQERVAVLASASLLANYSDSFDAWAASWAYIFKEFAPSIQDSMKLFAPPQWPGDDLMETMKPWFGENRKVGQSPCSLGTLASTWIKQSFA